MEICDKLLKVKTKTKEDVFGTVVYRVTNEKVETKDGEKIKCLMLGGTGPSAKENYPVWDLVTSIESGIENETIEIINEQEANEFLRGLKKNE